MKINKIVEALKNDDCVLFIGPEVLTKGGQDIQKLFYDTLSQETKEKAKYDDQEKLWTFANTKIHRQITSKLSGFYEANQDVEAAIFKNIASLPFSLIISLLPNDYLSKVFKHYNIAHEFDYFDVIERDCAKADKDNPLIYNLFGDIKTRKYVLSYPDFYDFTRSISIKNGLASNLKLKLQKANNYIFIGFEFSNWYNVLLMYILNGIRKEESTADKFIYENKNLDDLYKIIKDEGLNIEVIRENYTDFINNLYNSARGNNLLRKVQTNIENIENSLNEKQEYLEFLKEELITAIEPKVKFKMKREIKELESQIEKLKKELVEL